MAAFAACRYAGEIGKVSGIGTALNNFKAFSVEGKSNTIQFLASLSSFSSPSGYCRRSDYRPFSQFVKSNGGRLFLVDTLALVIIFIFFFLLFQFLVIVLICSFVFLEKKKMIFKLYFQELWKSELGSFFSVDFIF